MSTSLSMVKRNRAVKLNALGATLAIDIAKSYNDPMYARYKKFRDKFITMKKAIIRKYANKGRMAALQKLGHGGM